MATNGNAESIHWRIATARGGQIDAAWITANAGDYYFYWLDQTLVGGVPAGLSSFRSDVFDNWIWQPWKPGVGDIENPSPAHDQNGNTVDLDGNGVPDFDRDSDGLPDLWEYRYSLNLRSSQDSQSDPDGDALTNMQEYAAGTNPRLADSDGDGFSDAVELAQVAQGADPLNGAAGLPLVVQFVGGSYQAIYSGQTTPALAVQVTQGGLPVAGVSVAFQVEAGAGRLRPASSTAGTPGSSLSQTTAPDGIAAVTYESVAGEAEGTASISAVLAGVAARTFIVSIVAIPLPYGSDGAGGGDNVGGSNPARVPTPLRSTAASAASTAAASADGIRIRVKRRFDTDAGYPLVDLFPEYLASYGLNPAAVVGWQDAFETHSWGDYTRLDFEPLLPVAVPFARPVVPGGARRYLVLVNQGVDVGSDSSGPPLYVGSLTFSYTDTGVRVISLSRGNIPNEFMTVNGNESVSFEPPLASGAEGRVWIRLVPFELKIWNGQDAAAAVPENKKYTVGAFTVANLNDTDGDGGVNNTLDKDDNVVTKEKDLMKLYVGGYAGLTGKVKLTVKSGKERVKFWETKEKVTPIELDATGSLFYDIPAGGIGKILWVEVIAASVAVRDIEIWQGYQDAQGNLQDGLDKVKATAVWVDPGANGIITAGNQIPRDLDDLTAIRTFQNLHDSKFGIFDASPGKRQFSYSIGFEFKVKPAGIGNEPGIKFDVSRQRETIAWVKDNQVWFGGATAPFPTTPDEPNDDNHSEDEDNMPTNDHIYSMDNPLVPFLPAPGERAVKRGNFREFVRVFLDGQAFLNLNGKLEGSRCSNFQDWRMRGDITKTNNVWNLSPGGSNELQGGHVPLGAHP